MCVSESVSVSTDLTDVTLMSEETYLEKRTGWVTLLQRTHARNTDFSLFRDYTALNTSEAIGFSCFFGILKHPVTLLAAFTYTCNVMI